VRRFDPKWALRTLVHADVRFVVVGQVAAVLRGHPETTVDLDVLVEQEVDNAERLADALATLHAELVGPTGERTGIAPDQRTFLGWGRVVETDSDAGPIDVLPSLIGVGDYPEVRARADQVDLGDVVVSVAALADVIASKEAAGRPKDLARLPSLRAFAARRPDA
jgi:hypothetical protein